MTITRLGTFGDQDIHEVTLRTDAGACLSVLSWGAAIRKFCVPVQENAQRNVVLGFEQFEGYRHNPAYLGVIAGRFCNRIRNATFPLGAHIYHVTANEGEHTHLHGGATGFSRRNWTILDYDTRSVLLRLISEDGEEGYPGRVTVWCRYDLLEPATLRITLSATTEAATVINLTSHCYFTLNHGQDCRDHHLRINADHYLPTDSYRLPTGEIASVIGSPYDFRSPRSLRTGGISYDTNFILQARPTDMTPVAWLESPDGDLCLELATSQPGLQLYDGAGLTDSFAPTDGLAHKPFSGLCLETQHFPNSPNQPNFPSTLLQPGEMYQQVTEYRLSTDAMKRR